MDLFKNMDLFIEVARAGGFRRAAEALGLPNSTVSRRIAELESEVGVRLFARTTRKVELTEAGRVYFDRCWRIVEEAKRAREELSGGKEKPAGIIRASLPVDLAMLRLGAIMAEFVGLYPDVRFKLDLSPRRTDLISEPIDLAIRVGAPTEPNLIARKIGDFDGGLFASPHYLATRGAPARPEDLADHDCLRVNERPWTLNGRKTKESVVVAVDGPFVANNPGLLRSLALRDLGVIQSSREFAIDDLTQGRLMPVLEDWAPPPFSVYAITESRLLPLRVRRFIEFMSARMSDHASHPASNNESRETPLAP